MKLMRLVPAVAAVALLAACAPSPSTAVVVDGTTYTEAAITQVSKDCAQALGIEYSQIKRSAVVRTFILGGLFDKMAKMGDQPVSEESMDAYIRQNDPTMLSNAGCVPLARASAKGNLLSQADPAGLQAAMAALDVKLNPRYGTWQPKIDAPFTDDGSLSIPVAAAKN